VGVGVKRVNVGRSEILNGDCRDLIPTLPDNIPCIITDPPYGVAFKSFRATTPQGKRFVKEIENDGDMAGALALFGEAMQLLLPKTREQCDLYVFTKWDCLHEWESALVPLMQDYGFLYKMLLVWDKGIPGMGDLDGNWGCGHELIMYFKKGRREVPYRRSAIIHVDKLGSKQHIHPTEKPVALIERLVEMSTERGEVVVDPFAGSGSTVVAAMNLGRRGIGIEVDSGYADAARSRLARPTFFTENGA
jgi:site-specific DNA-methyltransferase (adenine-specific)